MENKFFTEKEVQDFENGSIKFPHMTVKKEQHEVVTVHEVVGMSGMATNNGIPTELTTVLHEKGKEPRTLSYIRPRDNFAKYFTQRGDEVHYVLRAAKDNSVAKKGESYYWVKTHKFANKLYFKDYESLPAKFRRNPLLGHIKMIGTGMSQDHIKEAIIYLTRLL
jgi:hypothetical protein